MKLLNKNNKYKISCFATVRHVMNSTEKKVSKNASFHTFYILLQEQIIIQSETGPTTRYHLRIHSGTLLTGWRKEPSMLTAWWAWDGPALKNR